MTKQQAVEYYGSQAALGRALGIQRAAVSAWETIPIGRQYQLEVITSGELMADRSEPKASQMAAIPSGRQSSAS